jgi:hypothetical protein
VSNVEGKQGVPFVQVVYVAANLVGAVTPILTVVKAAKASVEVVEVAEVEAAVETLVVSSHGPHLINFLSIEMMLLALPGDSTRMMLLSQRLSRSLLLEPMVIWPHAKGRLLLSSARRLMKLLEGGPVLLTVHTHGDTALIESDFLQLIVLRVPLIHVLLTGNIMVEVLCSLLGTTIMGSVEEP